MKILILMLFVLVNVETIIAKTPLIVQMWQKMMWPYGNITTTEKDVGTI